MENYLLINENPPGAFLGECIHKSPRRNQKEIIHMVYLPKTQLSSIIGCDYLQQSKSWSAGHQWTGVCNCKVPILPGHSRPGNIAFSVNGNDLNSYFKLTERPDYHHHYHHRHHPTTAQAAAQQQQPHSLKSSCVVLLSLGCRTARIADVHSVGMYCKQFSQQSYLILPSPNRTPSP